MYFRLYVMGRWIPNSPSLDFSIFDALILKCFPWSVGGAGAEEVTSLWDKKARLAD